MQGFTTFKVNPGTDLFLVDTQRPVYLVKITLYIVQTFVGDTFVVSLLSNAVYTHLLNFHRHIDFGLSGTVIQSLVACS